MNKSSIKALQVTEHIVSLLMAGGLGYIALRDIHQALLIAWGVVCSGAVAKLILFEIARKAKPSS